MPGLFTNSQIYGDTGGAAAFDAKNASSDSLKFGGSTSGANSNSTALPTDGSVTRMAPYFVNEYKPISLSLKPDLAQTGSSFLTGYSLGRNTETNGWPNDVPDPWSGYGSRMYFPNELTHPKNDWMYMSFTVRMGKPGTREIYLPIPPGLTFSDSMSYSTLDLGILGSIGVDAVNAMNKAGNVKQALKLGVDSLKGNLMGAMKMNLAAAASIVAKKSNSERVANTIDFSAKQVIAPNTNTTFQNVGVRSFGFNFKMMPKSRNESDMISKIIKTFRENMYPKGMDVILTYPPIWTMKFYDGTSGKENHRIPRIHECYLTGMSATYNGTTNMFHSDGSPVETDISLQFQETRALTLVDIVRYSEQ
jgi:hypothetical protein